MKKKKTNLEIVRDKLSTNEQLKKANVGIYRSMFPKKKRK